MQMMDAGGEAMPRTASDASFHDTPFRQTQPSKCIFLDLGNHQNVAGAQKVDASPDKVMVQKTEMDLPPLMAALSNLVKKASRPATHQAAATAGWHKQQKSGAGVMCGRSVQTRELQQTSLKVKAGIRGAGTMNRSLQAKKMPVAFDMCNMGTQALKPAAGALDRMAQATAPSHTIPPLAAVQALFEWQALSHRVVSAASAPNQATAWDLLSDADLKRFLAKMGKMCIRAANDNREDLIVEIKRVIFSARISKDRLC